jgi:hypothetical protein
MRQVVTFDAYGTLIDFRISDATRQILADRLPMDGVDTDEFLEDFRVMRFQAVLEPYRPYRDVLRSSLQIAMRLHGIPRSPSDGDALVAAVPAFGPFPEVPDALRAVQSLGDEIAIISNTDDDLIGARAVLSISPTTSCPICRPCQRCSARIASHETVTSGLRVRIRANVRQARAFPRRPAGRHRSDCVDLFGLQALGALAGGVLDLLVLFQGAVAAHVDGGVMNEDVGGAVVGGDETEALIGVEPLHGSLCHLLVSF